MTPALREARLELHETGTSGGYPVFRLITTGAASARPKNVIFGSARKPDQRVSDTVDSEIEVVGAGDLVIYDDPIGDDGLRWQDLQAWWHRNHPDLDDDDAATSALYRRLLECLPADSPPQRRLFEVYYRIRRSRIPCLPALLPDVWLHMEHKTVREGGVRALLGQRMDFLLLAPNHHRIVLEGRGCQLLQRRSRTPVTDALHAQRPAGPQPAAAGYTVYRFGGAELQTDDQFGSGDGLPVLRGDVRPTRDWHMS